MALPPVVQEELKKLSDLPEAPALEKEMESHAAQAETKARGAHITSIFNSIMIASENLADAERLAKVYAQSLIANGLVTENKVKTLDWQDVFNNAAKRDTHIAIADNLAQAFQGAEGGVLIIKEPYQCPPDMSPRDFAFTNYSATRTLMDKMDEVDDGFGKTVDALLKKGKNLSEIEGQINDKNFENPRNPAVILIGRPFEMESMLSDDPYPWNTRFMHRIGIADSAAEGVKPKHKKPSP
jgi:hypothetical protein